jgi:hypothetical protein
MQTSFLVLRFLVVLPLMLIGGLLLLAGTAVHWMGTALFWIGWQIFAEFQRALQRMVLRFTNVQGGASAK